MIDIKDEMIVSASRHEKRPTPARAYQQKQIDGGQNVEQAHGLTTAGLSRLIKKAERRGRGKQVTVLAMINFI